MRPRGWTLHEMLISLGVMGCVLALASHVAAGQLRFFRGVGEIAALRAQVTQASGIAAGLLWGVSPVLGDVLVAQDSAIEIHMPIGGAFQCASGQGRIIVPAAAAIGNTLAAFVEPPEAGDRVVTLFADSTGATWLTLRAASAPVAGGHCERFVAGAGWSMDLVEPVSVPAGAALRFTRPLRVSLYRASDGRWYMGAKDWNAAASRFNAIQPVAGPLRGYSANRGDTGLLFVYRDTAGEELATPVDASRIASVTIVARAATTHHQDSSVVVVALRNVR